MDKTFVPRETENRIYQFWEKKGLLKGRKGGSPSPYTILMPPPNANGSLHAGHGMYVIDDIMIRFKRLQGFDSVWIPGMDHAGFETQYVYEKYLAKQGKSRMDFDRETLYQDILVFVKKNSGVIYAQFKRLGFLADWERSVFTLDKEVVKYVHKTFKRMHEEGLVYRDKYIVNYCTHCGTTLADLEVEHIERQDPLYYIRYRLVDDETKWLTVATVRPEPIFVDTHLAVNPDDEKNKQYIGKKVSNPLTGTSMEVIGDEYVDPEFGTGIVKLTPAHDPHDFEVAKKKNLPIIQAIDFEGRITSLGGKYYRMKVKAAQEQIVNDLKKEDLIERIKEDYVHSVGVCYKCKHDLESMTKLNWFIRVDLLKRHTAKAIEKNIVVFHPRTYKEQILNWLSEMHDWPISRQIVWGIRIPIWYKITQNTSDVFVSWLDGNKKLQQGTVNSFLDKGIELNTIRRGLQKVYAGLNAEYTVSPNEPTDGEYLPETDTFDTWFSSGQWPLVTLQGDEYNSRFPTNFMGTSADILRFWVSRMIMFSLYIKNDVPFKDVYLWSVVTDSKGKKMSKSRGNVIDPLTLIDRYGADAFRASLIFGTGEGGRIPLSEEKVKAMRNFANKVWNIGRFIKLSFNTQKKTIKKETHGKLTKCKEEWELIHKSVIFHIEAMLFSFAFDQLYKFIWHRFADYYLETLKEDLKSGIIDVLEIEAVYLEMVQCLHPFMPFVTEAIWQEFKYKDSSILESTIKKYA